MRKSAYSIDKIPWGRCAIAIAFCLLCFPSCGPKKLKVEFGQDSIPSITDIALSDATLKVFIENSGSMDGYMGDGSELKDAIYGYVSSLEAEFGQVELYYINSQIVPIKGNITTFFGNLNPSSFHKGGGNRTSTDMAKLIENVLSQATDGVVCIFVSDCILDPQHGKAQSFFVKTSIDITKAVRSFINRGNNSIEILRMKSHFRGNYYGSDGVTKIDGERPYYIWVMGRNDLLAKMNMLSPFKDIPHGMTHWAAYSKKQEIPFRVAGSLGNLPKGGIVPFKGWYKLKVFADFSGLLPDAADFFSQVSRFNSSRGSIHVEKVGLDPTSPYTHVLDVAIKEKTVPGLVRIELNRVSAVPDWLEEVNDSLGTHIIDHMDQTTGIKYLIKGVADAYKQEDVLTSMEFSITYK